MVLGLIHPAQLRVVYMATLKWCLHIGQELE